MRVHLVDATRISDGKMVYIKRVKTGDQESTIALMFSSPAMRADPRNHSVPILDYFTDEEDPTISYIVMPFLREIDYPPFELVGDVVEFVDQILEVWQLIVFMCHELTRRRASCSCTSLVLPTGSYSSNFIVCDFIESFTGTAAGRTS
jgi:hypothetical protein